MAKNVGENEANKLSNQGSPAQKQESNAPDGLVQDPAKVVTQPVAPQSGNDTANQSATNTQDGGDVQRQAGPVETLVNDQLSQQATAQNSADAEREAIVREFGPDYVQATNKETKETRYFSKQSWKLLGDSKDHSGWKKTVSEPAEVTALRAGQ